MPVRRLSQDRTVKETAPHAASSPELVEHVFRWDLDKTYLATDFDRLRDLIRTAMQKAEEKRAVPGATALLRALLASQHRGTRRAVTFISGSPQQMRRVLERKLELDGIRPDAFVLKPNLQNLLLFRFRALRGQVGYKLRALLEQLLAGAGGPEPVPETLFGDDAEQDAVIYSIYAEIVAGRIRGDVLRGLLDAARVYSGNARAIVRAAERIEPHDRVRRIFINLDRRSPPARFKPYGARLVPVYNYFQAALVLYQDGLISATDLVDISLDMMATDGYIPFALTNSVQDIVRRGYLGEGTLRRIARLLREHPETGELARRYLDEFAQRIEALHGYKADAVHPSAGAVDYVRLLREELDARRAHKLLERQERRRRRRGALWF